MAIVAFDIKDFKRIDLSQDKIEEALVDLGIEIEEKSDKEIKINVTPNRPDLLDFIGLVRAIENFTEKKKPRENFYKINNQPVLTITVTEQVQKVRPYVVGLVVKNVDLSGNMLKYLINFTEKFADTYGRKRKKLAIGVHDLSQVNGNVTYTAAHDGSIVPLNEKKKISFKEVVETHDKGIMYKAAIPGNVYPYIQDSEKVIGLIPITNCEETKVTEKTKDLFIEITGTSINTLRNAAALCACSFLYAGADVYPVTVNYPKSSDVTPMLNYTEIKVSTKKASKTLGIEVTERNVVGLANKMGYVAAQLGNSVLFLAPPYRLDVLNDQDVIEDFAIAYGYDKITPLPVSGVADGLALEQTEFENKLATFMVGMGYTEAINSMLTNEKTQYQDLNLIYDKNGYVKIGDARTSSITMMRFHIAGSLLQNLSESKSEKMPQRLFEIGRAFRIENGETIESIQISMVSEHAKANFAELRSNMDALMKFLEMPDYKIEVFEIPFMISGRHVVIKVKGEIIGGFGEIHPDVLNNLGLEEPVVAGGITLVDNLKYD